MEIDSRNLHKFLIEEEKKFYLKEAGFNDREEQLFRLRAYQDKTLWEASEIMGYSSRTIDRVNKCMKKKMVKAAPLYYRGIYASWNV